MPCLSTGNEGRKCINSSLIVPRKSIKSAPLEPQKSRDQLRGKRVAQVQRSVRLQPNFRTAKDPRFAGLGNEHQEIHVMVLAVINQDVSPTFAFWGIQWQRRVQLKMSHADTMAGRSNRRVVETEPNPQELFWGFCFAKDQPGR